MSWHELTMVSRFLPRTWRGVIGRAATDPACRAEAQRKRKPSVAQGRRNPFRAPDAPPPPGLSHSRQRLECGGFSAALVRAPAGCAASSCRSRNPGWQSSRFLLSIFCSPHAIGFLFLARHYHATLSRAGPSFSNFSFNSKNRKQNKLRPDPAPVLFK